MADIAYTAVCANKNIPNIIDCNLKKNKHNQILIKFGTMFLIQQAIN